MKILVCVSSVPDTATKIKIAGDGKSIDEQGVKYVVNPYDEFAIEEALQIKADKGGETVAVNVGPDATTELRTALAMGVDKVVQISGEKGSDSFYAAYNLAEFAKEYQPDLILIGKQSVDYDSMQMASTLGELLEIPSVSVVTKLTVEDGKIIAERDIEGGKETVEATMPCVVSCQKGLNEPRYPKLPMIMKAKRKPIDKRDGKAVDARAEVVEMTIPSKRRLGKIFEADDEKIVEVVKLLREEAKVI